MTDRPDFWRSSGFHLLTSDDAGRLRVTPEFLRAFFVRPELQPVAESCDNERRLHETLLDDPLWPVPEQMLTDIADPDARENYRHVLRFRDRLAEHGCVEDCYLSLFADGPVDVPPLFVDQLTHVVLRHVLDDCADPLRLRAAELLFRTQKVSLQDGAILLADEETVEFYATTGGLGGLGKLLVQTQTPTRSVELDVLSDENSAIYWQRSDKFDTLLDLSFARRGLDALCRVLEAWIGHFLDLEVRVQPLASIRDEHWVWHVGLDAEASAILNSLYQGRDVDEDELARLLALFRLEFRDISVMLPSIAGRPVYLGLAMSAHDTVRLKPQNLLLNLPLVRAA